MTSSPFVSRRPLVPLHVGARVLMIRRLSDDELDAAHTAALARAVSMLHGLTSADLASVSPDVVADGRRRYASWRHRAEADPSMQYDDDTVLHLAGLSEDLVRALTAGERRRAARRIVQISRGGHV